MGFQRLNNGVPTDRPPSEKRTAAPVGPRRGGKKNRNALGSATSEYHKAEGEDNPNLAAALAHAKAGFVVFPAGQDKKPLVRWKAEATADEGQIERWFRKWPDAMPALPTGERNGFSVLDLDRKDGRDGLTELRDMGLDSDSLSHIQVATPSGGRHIYFRHLPGLGNSAGRIASAVDVRGEGGYVIAPGAVNGRGVYSPLGCGLTEDLLGLPEWPASLKPKPRAAEAATPAPEIEASEHDRAWAQDRLMAECAKLGATEPGERNDTLNRAAFNVGRIAAVGLLDRRQVWHSLLAACAQNGILGDDGADACRKTIKSGFRKGLAEPRHPPADLRTAFDDLDEPDETDADSEGPADAEPPKSGLTFLTPAECAELPPQAYVVKGLIGPGQIGCIFGDPGAGKSLIAPAMGYAVAQGRPTFGMKTTPGEVFYVAAEDATGMHGRVRALRMEHSDADGFKLVKGVSDLFAKGASDLKALRQAVKEQQPRLVIIDTLAMAFPGMDENTSEAMGRVVAVARALARHGAAVILIHHGTKAEGNTPRGHSIFNGALDMALHLKAKDDRGVVRGRLTKNRNGSADLDIAFTIGAHALGVDQDGDPITAAFAEELPPGAATSGPKLTKSERGALAVLHRLMGSASEFAESDWRKACTDGFEVSGSDTRDNRRRAVTEAVRGLVQKGAVDVEDGRARLPDLVAERFDDIGEGAGDA